MTQLTTTNNSLSPSEMAYKAENISVNKANLDTPSMFVLAFLAGAYIAFGAVIATTVATGGSALPYGVNKLLVGLVFTLGLILVVIGGAELFTGNNLIIIGYLNGKISLMGMLRNWGIVYLGNFVGSVSIASSDAARKRIYFCKWRDWINSLEYWKRQNRPGICSSNRFGHTV